MSILEKKSRSQKRKTGSRSISLQTRIRNVNLSTRQKWTLGIGIVIIAVVSIALIGIPFYGGVIAPEEPTFEVKIFDAWTNKDLSGTSFNYSLWGTNNTNFFGSFVLLEEGNDPTRILGSRILNESFQNYVVNYTGKVGTKIYYERWRILYYTSNLLSAYQEPSSTTVLFLDKDTLLPINTSNELNYTRNFTISANTNFSQPEAQWHFGENYRTEEYDDTINFVIVFNRTIVSIMDFYINRTTPIRINNSAVRYELFSLRSVPTIVNAFWNQGIIDIAINEFYCDFGLERRLLTII